MDIVDHWLHSEDEETVGALKALFRQVPDLLTSCLALLKTGDMPSKQNAHALMCSYMMFVLY